MTRTSFFNTRRPGARAALRIIGLAAVLFAICSMVPEEMYAQQIPRRVDFLQSYRGQITPPPLAPADRLRIDIIRATDPRTGWINVRQLFGPEPLTVPASAAGPTSPGSFKPLTGSEPLAVPGAAAGPSSPGSWKPLTGSNGLTVPGSAQ